MFPTNLYFIGADSYNNYYLLCSCVQLCMCFCSVLKTSLLLLHITLNRILLLICVMCNLIIHITGCFETIYIICVYLRIYIYFYCVYCIAQEFGVKAHN